MKNFILTGNLDFFQFIILSFIIFILKFPYSKSINEVEQGFTQPFKYV